MGINDFCAECGEIFENGKCSLCSDPAHARQIIDGTIDDECEVGTAIAEKHGVPIGCRRDAARSGSGRGET